MQQRIIPGWMGILFVLFLGYALYHLQDTPAPLAPTSVACDTAQDALDPNRYPRLRALVDADRWAMAINPTYQPQKEACAAEPSVPGAAASYAILLEAGAGEGLACGEAAIVELTPVQRDGTLGKPQRRMLTLGEQPGLDALLLGMREGEQRLLMLAPRTVYKALPALRARQWQTLYARRVVAEAASTDATTTD